MEVVALCCDIDDGRLQFVPLWQRHLVSDGQRQMWREQRLCLSEVMSSVISFQQSRYRTCKDYFLRHVTPHLRWAFYPSWASSPRRSSSS